MKESTRSGSSEENNRELLERKPLIVGYNEPFTLPKDINLDPDHADPLQSEVFETQVDSVQFYVKDSPLEGNILLFSAGTMYEVSHENILRPKGFTNPYYLSFSVNLPADLMDEEYPVPFFQINDGVHTYKANLDFTYTDEDDRAIWESFPNWDYEDSSSLVMYKADDILDLVITLKSIVEEEN